MDIYDSLPPGGFQRAWQLSQYRQYYGDVPEWGYPPPFRPNIDPNPHDSYRADEKPLQRAPAQTSIQGTTPNRSVRERQFLYSLLGRKGLFLISLHKVASVLGGVEIPQ